MSSQEYPFGIDRRRGDRRTGNDRRSSDRRQKERRCCENEDTYSNLKYHTSCINKILNDISNDIHQINKNMQDGK